VISVRNLRRIVRVWPVALLLLGVSGCFNPFAPRIAPINGIYVPPPTPDSPQGVIRLFEWCWNNRDITTYKEILTADFRFVFALGDSAGNQFRDDPVTREMELTIARNLFVGGSTAPPATSIYLNLDPTLRPLADSRPGKNPKWHKEIVTGVDLTIKTEGDQEYRILGNARFFVVRGDSALIPQELSFKPDSNRWYIDQWNDETLTGTGGTALAPAGPGGLQATRSAVQVTVTGIAGAPRGARVTRAPAVLTSGMPFLLTWGQLNAIYAR
jgi:hypothetical protein